MADKRVTRTARYLSPSCDRCYQQKKKCDRQHPCGHCVRTKKHCSYQLSRSAYLQSRGAYSKIKALMKQLEGKKEFRRVYAELKDVIEGIEDPIAVAAKHISFSQYTEDADYECPISTMPDIKIGEEMAAGYFGHHHIGYPFIDQKQWYGCFYSCYKSAHSLTHHEIFKVYMVLLIGGSFLIQRQEEVRFSKSDLASLLELSEKIPFAPHFYAENPDPRYIERILLLIAYSYFSAEPSNNLWHLIGLACRHVVALGFHRVPPITTSWEDAEMRSRIFWSVYSADRLVSTSLGLPLAIHDDIVSADFPSMIENASEPTSDKTLSSASMTRLLLKNWKVRGEIFSELYGGKTKLENPQLAELLEFLKQKADNWLLETQDLFTQIEATALNGFTRPPELFRLFYEHLIELIYRPSPAMPVPPPEYADILLTASHSSSHLLHLLIQRRKINRNWTTMYYILNDAMVFVQSHFSNQNDSECVDYLNLCINDLDQWDSEWTKAHEASTVLKKVVHNLTERNSIDATMTINKLSSNMLGYGSSYILSNSDYNNLDILTDKLLDWLDSVADDMTGGGCV